jgi:hypothetical protein
VEGVYERETCAKLVYETIVGEVWETAGNFLDFSLYLYRFSVAPGGGKGVTKSGIIWGYLRTPNRPSIQQHQHHPVSTTDNWIKILKNEKRHLDLPNCLQFLHKLKLHATLWSIYFKDSW